MATQEILTEGSHNSLPISMHKDSAETHPLRTRNNNCDEELTPKFEGVWTQEEVD